MKIISYGDYIKTKNFKITENVIQTLIFSDLNEYGAYISSDASTVDRVEELNELLGLGRRTTPAEKELKTSIAKEKEHLAQEKNIKSLLNKEKKLKHDVRLQKLSPKALKKLKGISKAKWLRRGKTALAVTAATGLIAGLIAILKKKLSVKKEMQEAKPGGADTDNLKNTFDTLTRQEMELRNKIRAQHESIEIPQEDLDLYQNFKESVSIDAKKFYELLETEYLTLTDVKVLDKSGNTVGKMDELEADSIETDDADDTEDSSNINNRFNIDMDEILGGQEATIPMD